MHLGKRLLPAVLFALALLYGAPAMAQGCGQQNPNCIVPTAPVGTSNNQAASTAFVQNQIAHGIPYTDVTGLPGMSMLGSIAGGNAQALTPAQVTTFCNVFTASLIGCVPAPVTSSGRFLRDDETWASIPGATPSALTEGDDTNVTLTLTGTPATALLQAVKIQAGWTGQTSVPRGGTGQASFTANLPIIGNATGALGQGTRSGTTTAFGTVSGVLTPGDCVKIDASGNLIDNGSTCGAGSNTAATQNFIAGTGFTPGTTTSLTLSSSPTNANQLLIAFDGVVQSHDTWSLSGAVVTFTVAIPANVNVVEAQWYTASTTAGVGSITDSNGNVATGTVTLAPPLAVSSNVITPGGACFVQSRAAAILLHNLITCSIIRTGGYYTAGDGGRADFTNAASQPFCGPFSDTSSFQDADGNWWKIAEPIEYNPKQFGAKMDSIYGISGTDDTAAVLSTVRCAGVVTGPGNDLGGGAGKTVRIPAGWSLISSQIIVPNQVPVLGVCPICNGFDMAGSFVTNAHFIIEGDQFTQSDVAASQSRGSAGNLTLNSSGQFYRSGAIYTLQPYQPAIYSASNNSGVNFTFTGTDRYGNAQTETIAGPAANTSSSSAKFWLSITQVATSAATVSNITIGYPQIATFGTRLENIELFSEDQNAVQFTTFINCCGTGNSGVTGLSGNAMVYTNSAQHTAGLKNVKIFGGNRSAVLIEQGVGGASYITLQDIETNNAGNCSGCASNNPQTVLAYAGLAVPISNFVVSSCGAPCGSVALGIDIQGGFVTANQIHCEAVAGCMRVNFTSVNSGSLSANSIEGGNSVTNMINILSGTPANNNYLCYLHSNGATNIVNNQGTLVTGNQIGCTTY